MKKRNILKRVWLFLFAMVMMLGLVACGNDAGGDNKDDEKDEPKMKTVAVADTVSITFSGYDGYGSARISNQNAWIDLMEVDTVKTETDRLALRELLKGVVTYTLSKEEDIANGEELVLTIEANNSVLAKYDYYIEKQTKTIKVEGLEELKELDPFANATCSFEGVAPFVRANINFDYLDVSDDLYRYIRYDFSNTTNLSNGDIASVKVMPQHNVEVPVAESLGRMGYKLTRESIEYTVDGVDALVKTISQIPSEKLVEMRNQGIEYLKVVFGQEDMPEIKDISMVGNYILHGNRENKVIFVYLNTVYASGEYRYLTTGTWTNVILNGDEGKTLEIGSNCDISFFGWNSVAELEDWIKKTYSEYDIVEKELTVYDSY